MTYVHSSNEAGQGQFLSLFAYLPPLFCMSLCKKAPKWDEVTENLVFRGPGLPGLGLETRRDFSYRVYVLKCADRALLRTTFTMWA